MLDLPGRVWKSAFSCGSGLFPILVFAYSTESSMQVKCVTLPRSSSFVPEFGGTPILRRNYQALNARAAMGWHALTTFNPESAPYPIRRVAGVL